MTDTNILALFRSPNTVFTAKEIALLWRETNKNKLKSRLNYYTKTGKLYPLRRGIYAKDKNYDKLELAAKIFTPSYISLETILTQEGIVFQYYKQIFVISYLTREITINGQNYNFRKIKDVVLTNPLGLQKRGGYFTASKERAFLDAVYLYKNYHFDNLSTLNWPLCFKLAPIYQNKSLIKKLNSYHQDFQDA